MLDTEILSAIQSVLLEPDDAGATFPSGLWTPTEVRDRLSARQDRFAKATGILLGTVPLLVHAGVERVTLPQDWLSTVDVVWVGTDGTIRTLERADGFEADHGMPTWATTPGTPLLYMDYEAPTLQLQLAPLPLVSGRIDLLYVPQAPPVTGTGDPLMLPDEFAEAACLYGTLADLWGKDGRGRSPARAAYAALRYQLGIDAARIILESSWT